MVTGKMLRLVGRLALITGASSGLGARFAEVASANGAAVVLVARRRERLDALKTKIEQSGGRALAAPADVTDPAALAGAFDAAEKTFGTVDLMVANAGIARIARALDMTRETWREVLDADLDAVYFGCQQAAKRMVAAKKPGVIVTIAAIAGFGVERGLSGR